MRAAGQSHVRSIPEKGGRLIWIETLTFIYRTDRQGIQKILARPRSVSVLLPPASENIAAQEATKVLAHAVEQFPPFVISCINRDKDTKCIA
jgi:hypothetical protein